MKDNLKAMVLAAGVGSRLDPLTKRLPKPLIPVANRPVMEHILMWLNEHGINDVASNLHYLPQKSATILPLNVLCQALYSLYMNVCCREIVVGCALAKAFHHVGEIVVDGLGGYQTSALNVVSINKSVKLAS